MIGDLFLRLLPLWGLIGVGFLARRLLGIGNRDVGALLLYLLSPAIIFQGIYQSALVPAMLALPVLSFTLATLFAWSAFRLAGRIMPDDRRRIAAFSAGTGNTGFFGIPACMTLLGPDVLPFVAAYMLGWVFYEVGYGYYLVQRGDQEGQSAMRRLFIYPGLHAAWIAVLFRLLDIPVPGPIIRTLDYMAGGYTLLGMMVIGMGIATVSLRRLDLRFTGFTFAVKFLAWPAVTWLVITLDNGWMNLFDPTVEKVMMLQSCTPLAALVSVHSTLQNSKPGESSLAVAISTGLSLLILPYVAVVMGAP